RRRSRSRIPSPLVTRRRRSRAVAALGNGARAPRDGGSARQDTRRPLRRIARARDCDGGRTAALATYAENHVRGGSGMSGIAVVAAAGAVCAPFITIARN